MHKNNREDKKDHVNLRKIPKAVKILNHSVGK